MLNKLTWIFSFNFKTKHMNIFIRLALINVFYTKVVCNILNINLNKVGHAFLYIWKQNIHLIYYTKVNE